MNPFKRFASRRRLSKSSKLSSSDAPLPSAPTVAPMAALVASSQPFARTTPTRRPQTNSDAPPAYSPPAKGTVIPGSMETTSDSPYAFLTEFDTVFLIDDSGSMAGRSWRETAAALSAITPICTSHDANGIDIFFLNHKNPCASDNIGGYTNLTTTAAVDAIFKTVRPLGGTPTGTRLNQIIKPYLRDLKDSMERQANDREPTVKPMNVIVITDGVPSDDVESVIVSAAKKLDSYGAEAWQMGIQFFQVGREPDAAEDLQELDDALASTHGVRDMVDTVPWTGDEGQTLTADGLLKVCLGSVVRRWDRKKVHK
jgi:hypothetical protein